MQDKISVFWTEILCRIQLNLHATLADDITVLRAWGLIATMIQRKRGVIRPGIGRMRDQW